MTHKKKIGTVAYYVVGILIAILAIIPFLWMVSTSLKARGALMSIPIEWIPKEPTVASYVKVFSKFPFFSTIGNSLFISVTYTFITLISASMAAFAFAKLKFPKADLLLKVFLATMMIPTQVTIIPLFVVMNKMSLIKKDVSLSIRWKKSSASKVKKHIARLRSSGQTADSVCMLIPVKLQRSILTRTL